jgi:2-aminoadipate transaminase
MSSPEKDKLRRFSKATSALRTSAIRDLMSLAIRPDIISFSGGMPGNDLFPIDEVDRIYSDLDILKKQAAFQYGPTSGYPPLLESLKFFLSKKGLPVDENKLMITTGSLQAINILTKVFIDPGDVIITENPCFIGAISAFRSYEANIESVPLDEEGINIELLKETLNKNDEANLLYLTPYFHNPAGIIYSTERKQAILDLMKNRNIPILEDDAYGDLYFYPEDRELVKPMKAINPKGIDICYTGSFSKILGPGLRLGWMLVPDEIYQKAELCKQSFDACSPTFTQVIADEFLRSGMIYSYIERLRAAYKSRAAAMIDCLRQNLPDYVKFSEPRGGFYIWIELPEDVDSTLILQKAIEKGVVLVIGKAFDPDAKKNNFMRLSFSNTPEDAIRKGIPLVAEAIRSVCG